MSLRPDAPSRPGSWGLACQILLYYHALTSLPTAEGNCSGVVLTGNPQEGTPPAAIFGSEPQKATIVTTDGNSVELMREGAVRAAFGTEATFLPQTFVDGELSVASGFSIAGQKQWALWDLDTFDKPGEPIGFTQTALRGSNGQMPNWITTAWSVNDRSFCGSPHDQFLGGHCQFGATQTTKKFANLPPHSRIRVRARVHYLDKWEGDAVEMLADGNMVWSQAHEWCPGFLKWKCTKFGIDTCGQSTPDRLSVKAEGTFPHSSPTLELTFGSTLPQGTDACQVSWGVDDVAVELL